MKTIVRLSAVLAVALGLFALAGAPAWAGLASALTDAELDGVYGGKPDDDRSTLLDAAAPTVRMTQTITGAAQQATSALIGPINALNSVVTAQVNVITNLGTIGVAAQTNGAGIR